MSGYHPYPAYKSSGIDWLGDVPEHWDVRRIKYLFHERDERTATGTERLFSLSKEKGLLPRQEITDKEARADTLVGYKRFYPGDIVMNKMQAWNGVFGFSRSYQGIVTGEYTVLCPKEGLSPRFFTDLFRTATYVAQFGMAARGMGTAFLRLNTSDLGHIPALVPPLEEQFSIAAFLDWETSRIDAAIGRYERLIELLGEKRQALISHAVTKGLDSDAPMKDSGVDWLGEVPEHWEVGRAKQTVTACINGIWGDEPTGGDDDLICIRVADFNRVHNRVMGSRFTLRSIATRDRVNRLLTQGDLLIEKSGGGDSQPVGTVVLFDLDVPAVTSNFVARMPVASAFNPTFLCYVHSALYAHRITMRSIKQTTGIQNLDSDAYLNERIGMPPLLEQDAIANYLDAETGKFDSLTTKARNAIELLKEHRTSLISAVVTGKIDVRQEAKIEAVV